MILCRLSTFARRSITSIDAIVCGYPVTCGVGYGRAVSMTKPSVKEAQNTGEAYPEFRPIFL